MTTRLTLRYHSSNWGREAAGYEKIVVVCADISLQTGHPEGMFDGGHLGIVWQVMVICSYRHFLLPGR